MTIKNKNKNVSAEHEDIIIDVIDDISGIITFHKKDLRDDSNEIQSIEIDLSKHKLNLIEKSTSDFSSMVSDTNKDAFYTPERIAENKSGVFLVPTESSGEGIYEEFYWGEISDSNNYQNTDYIDENNKHYNFISLQSMSINLQPIQDELDDKVDKVSGKQLSTNDFTTAYKQQLDNLGTTYATKQELNNKVDKVSGKQLSTNDFDNGYKNFLDGITTEALDITYDDNGTDVTETITFLIIDDNS